MARVIVIGAGVGGVTTAALLAQAGYDVTVLEGQTYPGGCASTFTHKGYRFESGATVVGGFQPNGPHAIVGDQLNVDWPVHRHEPAWVTHMPGFSVALTSNNDDVVEKFPGTEVFWEQQSKIAEIAWALSAQGLPWPPRDFAELSKLVKVGIKDVSRNINVLPFAFSSVYDWLRWHGLHHNEAFVRFLDAQLLISAQTTSHNVNALYGATALDLARQGVFHVEGGIGNIAETVIKKLEDLGGEVRYRHHVTRIKVENGKAVGVNFKIGRRSKSEEFIPADFVIVNTTPWNLHTLLGEDSPSNLVREVKRRKFGWGAFVLHIGVNESAAPSDTADHHQIIRDMSSPLGETNSLFLSFSPLWDETRAPQGKRALTVTTHTHVQQWWNLLNRDEALYYAKKDRFTDKIIHQINKIFPKFEENIDLLLPGSPVTYQFYTARHRGMVGGFPQTSLFKARSPQTGILNLRLVGDSIFPGQSTAGVTLGAMRVADDVKRNLPVDLGHRTPMRNLQNDLQSDPNDELVGELT